MIDNSNVLRVKDFTVSPELFTQGYASGRGPCTCTSVCCEGGVYVDLAEREKILSHKEMIKRYLDETQTTDERLWFEEREFNDADFPSGRCVGTREVNDKCAFLDKFGRCSLQVAATGEGMHRWAIKPMFCVLYPIAVSDNFIAFDDMLQDEESCCTITADFEIPVFHACREELTHLLGPDGYDAMQMYYSETMAPARGLETRAD